MNPNPPPNDPKRASAAGGASAAASPQPATNPAQAGELDLEVEEIKLPERMKEGFVGQER